MNRAAHTPRRPHSRSRPPRGARGVAAAGLGPPAAAAGTAGAPPPPQGSPWSIFPEDADPGFSGAAPFEPPALLDEAGIVLPRWELSKLHYAPTRLAPAVRAYWEAMCSGLSR
jgi:hypothetical protein